MTQDIIYDIEVYPNILLIGFYDPAHDKIVHYEMSDWKDDWAAFMQFVAKCESRFVRWVGFNNFYYDYQVLHRLIKHEPFHSMKDKAGFAHKVSDKLFALGKEEKFNHIIWQHEHVIPQIDLFRIHHFDNMARATSLKKLEFNMRSETIKDLPYKPGSIITEEQRPVLIKYNIHDLKETAKFYRETKDMIEFREKLTKKYNKNFMNHNDTKIGKDYFIMELEAAGIDCFRKNALGERVPIQTKRPYIKIKDIIFPYIEFERPEFNAVKDWLERQTITQTKGVFTEIDDLGSLEQYANLKKTKGKVKNLNCIIDGFQFDFGTGGIHGSVDSTMVEEDDYFAIIDYDVTSLYPSIAIANGVYPKHLTKKFCDIYAAMKKDRMSYAKGTPENAMLKLALNGVYGDSNNPYSCFFDPQYTMTITINGQLMLCMLAEQMMKISKIIQINTDGVTIKVARKDIEKIEQINKEWQKLTGLDLERADYNKMFIRDVNNYMGLYTNGKVKRKGAYEYNVGWHQNHSALVVQKAVEAHLLKGVEIDRFIKEHDDMFDFMLRTNVPRTSRLLHEFEDPFGTMGDTTGYELQNVTRYYISTDGGTLMKVMPPLPKKPNVERRIGINTGYKATEMNTMGEVKNINYDWYIKEARKLADPLWAGYINDMIS